MTEASILADALRKPLRERSAFLDDACGGDAELRARVQQLLKTKSHASDSAPAKPTDKSPAGSAPAGGLEVTVTLEPSAVSAGDLPNTLVMESSPPARSMDRSGPNPDASKSFVIGKRIAQGGMGAILEANDCKLGRKIAVKVMLLESGGDEDQKQRFIQEAAVLGRLEHPNIVPIHDLGRDSEGHLYYTMKLVQGNTLQGILNELRCENPAALREYTLDRLLTIFCKVCDAIAFAHSRRILHRDLKPENIMVGEFGEVLVMDWGLSKILDESRNGDPQPPGNMVALATGASAPEKSSDSVSATQQGTVMGTPKFMSPEQAMGLIDELDERSDIFSLGGILYAILTLRPPVEGKSVKEVLEKVCSGSITSPTTFGSTIAVAAQQANGARGDVLEAQRIKPLPHILGGRVPPAISAVTMKALTLDKAKRYQDVTTFRADIEKFQGGFATTAEQAGLGKQLVLLIKRHKGIFSTAAAGWLLVTALAVWFVLGLRAKERRAVEGEGAAKAAEAVAVQKEGETRQALARSALSLAEAALREGNGTAMQGALNDVPGNLRDANWRYLLDQSDASFARIRTGTNEIDGVVAHPRLPSVFAVVDRLGVVTFLNVRTGEHLLEFAADLPKRDNAEYCIAISSDGERIAVGSAGADSGIAIHNGRDGTKLLKWDALREHPEESKPDLSPQPPDNTPFFDIENRTSHLVFSPDGRWLLQAEVKSRFLNLWDAATGHVQWTREARNSIITASFTPDSLEVFVQELTSEPIFVSVGAKEQTRRVAKSDAVRADTAVLRLDGQLVVTGDRNGTIKGIDHPGGHSVFEIRASDRAIDRLVFNTEGDRFVSIVRMTDGRQAIRLWTQNGDPLQSLLGGIGEVRDASVHPLSEELVVCGSETRVWSIGGARWKFRARGNASIAFWGEDVFAPEHGGHTKLQKLQADGSTEILTLTHPENWYRPDTANVSSDGRFAALGFMRIVNLPILLLRRNGLEVEQLGSFQPLDINNGLRVLRLSPTGKRIATLRGAANSLETVDLVADATAVKIEPSNRIRINDVCWLTDEHLLGLMTAHADRGSSGSEEQIVVWDAASGDILRHATSASAIDVLAVSPDGSRFAEAGTDKHVRIRDGATLGVQQEFRAHDGPITALAWHPSKPILATGSTGLTIHLWNLETGKRIEELRGPLAAPHTLAFAPDGQRLGCASLDGVTRIWALTSLSDGTAAGLNTSSMVIDEHRWFADPLSYPYPTQNEPEDRDNLLTRLSPTFVRKINNGHGWVLKNGVVYSSDSGRQTLPLPIDLSDISYSVHVKLQQLDVTGSFILCLPLGQKTITFHLDAFPEEGHYTGLTAADRPNKRNHSVLGQQIHDSELHDLVVTVRLDRDNAAITATLDAKPIYDWTGPVASLGLHRRWTPPSGVLSLATQAAEWSVSRVSVKRLKDDSASVDTP